MKWNETKLKNQPKKPTKNKTKTNKQTKAQTSDVFVRKKMSWFILNYLSEYVSQRCVTVLFQLFLSAYSRTLFWLYIIETIIYGKSVSNKKYCRVYIFK